MLTRPRRNGQLFGGTWSVYYFLGDLLDGNHSYFIRIEAADVLVDPYGHLRHGLQSAFDGDPSTSFNTNHENEFMRIMFSRADLPVSKVAVIKC